MCWLLFFVGVEASPPWQKKKEVSPNACGDHRTSLSAEVDEVARPKIERQYST
jgi:hypothetical protein